MVLVFIVNKLSQIETKNLLQRSLRDVDIDTMKTAAANIVLSSLFLFSHHALATKIVQVKNGKVMIDTEGDSFNVGDQLTAIDGNGKKRGRLTIKKLKGRRALADVDKGNVQASFTLEAYSGSKRRAGYDGERNSESSTAAKKMTSQDKTAWGLMAGFSQNSMTVQLTGASAAMKGSSYSLLGFYQIALDKDISVKGYGGYQTLIASGSIGTAVCSGSTNCTIDISYIGLDAVVRYTVFRTRTIDFWMGAGFGYLFPISKTSSAVNTGSISANITYNFVLGVDYHLNKNHFVPIEFNYGVFPSNSSAEANQMSLSAGYGWSF